MIVVDAYSKWLEVFCMSQITSQATITRLKRLFSAYGLPEQIVTHNATTFTSDEFQRFVKRNGILHTTAAPDIQLPMDWLRGMARHLRWA